MSQLGCSYVFQRGPRKYQMCDKKTKGKPYCPIHSKRKCAQETKESREFGGYSAEKLKEIQELNKKHQDSNNRFLAPYHLQPKPEPKPRRDYLLVTFSVSGTDHTGYCSDKEAEEFEPYTEIIKYSFIVREDDYVIISNGEEVEFPIKDFDKEGKFTDEFDLSVLDYTNNGCTAGGSGYCRPCSQRYSAVSVECWQISDDLEKLRKKTIPTFLMGHVSLKSSLSENFLTHEMFDKRLVQMIFSFLVFKSDFKCNS